MALARRYSLPYTDKPAVEITIAIEPDDMLIILKNWRASEPDPQAIFEEWVIDRLSRSEP